MLRYRARIIEHGRQLHGDGEHAGALLGAGQVLQLRPHADLDRTGRGGYIGRRWRYQSELLGAVAALILAVR